MRAIDVTKVFLVSVALLLLLEPAFAQTEPTTADRPCAPVRATAYSGYFPSLPSRATRSPELALGYRQVFVLHQPVLADETLARVRSAAIAAGNPCAEALALYGLGASAEAHDFKNAAPLYRQSLELFEALHAAHGTAVAHFSLGRVAGIAGNTAESSTHYKLAEETFRASGDVRSALSMRLLLASREKDEAALTSLAQQAREMRLPCLEASIEHHWSDAVHTGGRFAEAMQHDQRADALYAHCPNDKAERAYVQTSMGRMERQQGRPQVALEHYRVALRLQMESGDLSFVAQTYNAMAVAYENMKDTSHALALYRKGLAMAKASHSQPMIDFLEANLGATYARSGQPALGIPFLERASLHLGNDYLRCVRQQQLGGAYGNAGRNDEAVATLTAALAVCRKVNEVERVTDALQELSRAQLALGHPAAALSSARDGLKQVEETRLHLVDADAYKQGFITQSSELFDDTIAALTALNQPSQALEVAEQARSRAFLDLLGSHQRADKDAATTLRATPTVTPLSTPAMLEEIQLRHSTLLAYWSTPKMLYIWIAHPGGQVVEKKQPVGADRLARLVEATHSASAGTQPWRELYNLLLSPVEHELPASDDDLITIVPSGPLFSLSFAALLSPKLQYLAERFRTHTIPSVGLFRFTRQSARGPVAKPYYVFVGAPAHMPSNGGATLSALQNASVEIHRMAGQLPADQVHILEGSKAEVEVMLREIPSASVLHFATHAVVSDTKPFDSFLALDDSQGRGRFTLTEAYALHLRTSLVVLSACRTGRGKITGDGIDGLTRAFFSAGSASVLATLWDVADRPTSLMMPSFYKELQAGHSPSAALRSAQMSMLKDLRAGRIKAESLSGMKRLPPLPAYWAAFSLSGEP